MNFILKINSLIAAIFLLLFHQGFTDFTKRPCQQVTTKEFIMFTDLDDFKKSKATFIKGKDGFQGNRVIFPTLTNRKLEKKSFICETCEFIVELTIRGVNLKEIEDGAFKNLRCLKNLDMTLSKITTITPKTFAELHNLKMLAIQRNKLRVLKNNTFAKNRLLKELDLTSNEIYNIEQLAFNNLSSLERLLLAKNNMVIINFEIFRNLPKLKYLYLAENLIEKIEPSKAPFSNTIETIDVSYNQLTEGMENIYLPNIVKIKFTKNRIKKLDVKALKHNCPKLKNIEIFDNFLECGELPNITKLLQEAKIRYGQPIKCIEKSNDEFYQDIVICILIILFITTPVVLCIIIFNIRKKETRIYAREEVDNELSEEFEEMELETMEENEEMDVVPKPVVRLAPTAGDEDTESSI